MTDLTPGHEHDIAGCMDCDCCAAPHVTDKTPCTCPKPSRRMACPALTPFATEGALGGCDLPRGHGGAHRTPFYWSGSAS